MSAGKQPRHYQISKQAISFSLFFFALILAFTLSFPASVGQAKPLALTIVAANNATELIARINEANANSDDYVINLTNTTYELTTIDNNTDGANGLPSILNNGSLTINGNGATIKRNSASQFRIFHIAAGANVTLKNLTLENGLAQGAGGTGGGGGGAGFGGAIFNRGNLIFESSTVLNNQAIGGDGATGSGGTGGGFNTPAGSGGTGSAGTDGGLNVSGSPGGDTNGSDGGFGSGGSSGGNGGLGGGGGGDGTGIVGTGGTGGRGGHASGGNGGFGSGGGPGGTAGIGGGGGGGGSTGGTPGETGNTDGDGFGGDGASYGGQLFNNGNGGNGGTGGNANGGVGGFGGGGGRAGTRGVGGGGGGGVPGNSGFSGGNGGSPGQNGSLGGGAVSSGFGFAGASGSANGGSGGFGGGTGSSTVGGGGGGFGGAIFNYLGTVAMTNTTFYSNTAQGGGGANGGSGFGGAIFNYQGDITATNNTLSHNIVEGNTDGTDGQQQGGVMYNYQGNLTLVNTILANSSGDNDCQTNGGTVTAPANSGNLIETHSGCGTPAFTSDPNLASLQDNGGLTHTMAPIFPSDVVDGGANTGCPATDQRGVSRPQRTSCDIGAVEDELLGLSIDKKVSPASAGPGEMITYTISFDNTDADTATGVVITDIVPISVTNISVISQVDTTITDISTTEKYVWQVADLSNGQSGVITLTGELSYTLPASGVFTNTVSITTTAADVTIINTEAQAKVDVTCATVFTVRNANDSGDGSLRKAIELICDGGTITFDNNYNIYLDSTLSIAKKLTIDALDKTITISGDSNNDNSRNVRVFHITGSGVTTLSHLSIVSGTGGILNDGVLTVNNSTIADNVTGTGGGIANNNQLTLNYSTVSNNAANDGGGIYNGENKTLALNNSTLSGNSAQNGGAIYNANSGAGTPGGKVFINNSTIFGNSAGSSNSGAIYNGDSSTSGNADVTIRNSTLSNNSGGGIITFLNDRIFLYNSIVANSISGNDCDNSSGTVSANNNSLIEDGSCSPTLSGDPLLSTPGNYGGDTQTMALLPGSPAIDTGNSATCSDSATINNLDQRGIVRPSACDIGAFESQGFNLSITGGNNQSTITNTVFATPLEVTVSSDNGEPVGAGGVISFTAPGSGAGLNTTAFTATTNSSGIASSTVTANNITGTYQVTVTTNGASNIVIFNLTNGTSATNYYLPIIVKDN